MHGQCKVLDNLLLLMLTPPHHKPAMKRVNFMKNELLQFQRTIASASCSCVSTQHRLESHSHSQEGAIGDHHPET